jgi:hypothetical protein
MRSALGLLLVIPPMAVSEADSPKEFVPTVKSSLSTDSGQIRQFAFDGNPDSYFASKENPKTSDEFTMSFPKPIVLKALTVTSGKPDRTDKLEAGSLQVSGDGQVFEDVAKFAEGTAKYEAKDRTIQAIRIKPTADLTHPLVIREIAIESAEPVAKFRYPVEFTVVVTDAPEMKEWADKVAQLCEEWYSRLNDQLKSDGFKPATQISMTLKSDYGGVAETSGNRITGSVKFFKEHPEDQGAMIHETCHVIQQYRGRNPGWLVEGVTDYVRFFVYEPGKARPVNRRRAHYNDSYQTTATFLAYVSEKYDKELILKLNKLMRQGKYREGTFRELTGKTLKELDEEWLASLAK